MKTTVRSLESFKESFKALQRRAKRLGIEQPSFTVLATRVEPVDVHTYDPMGNHVGKRTVDAEVYDIEVTGANRKIMIGGWEFMAKLTPHGDGNIIAGFSGEDIPERYRTCAIGCDHCESNRRRNDSFVLRKDDVWKQVGRNCLSVFTQAASAERVCAEFEFFSTVSEFMRDYGDGERAIHEGGHVQAYNLTTAVAFGLEAHGGKYISSAMAEERGVESTAARVKYELSGKIQPKPESEEMAEVLIEEAKRLPDDGSQYMANLKTILRSGYVTWQTIGIGVSLIAAVNRSRKVKVEKEEGAKSQHVGTVGDRIVVEGEIVNRFGYDTPFGWVEKVVLRDADGNLLVAKNLPGVVGDTIRMKATVKEHSEFRGANQTILARPHKPEIIKQASAA